jgi:acid phosphatase
LSNSWTGTEKAEAVAPTLAVLRVAQAAHIAVFFITGRDETVRAAAEKNLRQAGYDSWVRLIMRPAHSKAPQRARIESEGYTIIANIGDQPSDLAGGHAEKTFLIPNPFYRIL